MEGLEFSLFGIPAVLIVMGLLEALKRVWLDVDGQPVIKDRWAVIAAVIIGLLVSLVAKVSEMFPAFAEWAWVIVAGLFTGFSAAGVFSLVKKRDAPQ